MIVSKIELNKILFFSLLCQICLVWRFIHFVQNYFYRIESGFSNKLFLSYLDMAQITLNEAAKYSIFLVLGSLLYIIMLDADFNREKYDVTVNQTID